MTYRPLLLLLAGTLLAACEAPPPNLRPAPVAGDTLREQRAAERERLQPFLAKRPKDYPLYPGDEIRITVQGHPDLTVERKIPADGTIPIFGVRTAAPAEGPEGGGEPATITVEAAGRRIPELEAELVKIYSRTYQNPYVTVRVVNYAPKTVFLAGAVQNPRDYRLPDEERITLVQALTMAGWFTESAARDRVRVMRLGEEGGERIHLPPIDVTEILSGGDVELDLVLEPGDTVMVDERDSQSVYIWGYVEDPGEVPYVPDLTLTRLISLVGGLKEYAKLSNVRVMRGTDTSDGQVFRVNLEDVFEGRAPDFPLAPGDVIYVDETFF